MARINSLIAIDQKHLGGLRRFPFLILERDLKEKKLKVREAK